MADSIHVTCNACNNVIKAPRAAAGKRGKCPHCKNMVYVPTPPDELEDIPLSPLDDTAKGGTQHHREDQQLVDALRRELGEDNPPSDTAEAPAADRKPAAASAQQVGDSIVAFLLAMQSSNLQEAERIAGELRDSAPNARDRVQQMMVDAMPPRELRDLPPALYQGFLRKLLDQLR